MGDTRGAVPSLVPLDFSSRLGGVPTPRLDWRAVSTAYARLGMVPTASAKLEIARGFC